jgi:hypothetical protein
LALPKVKLFRGDIGTQRHRPGRNAAALDVRLTSEELNEIDKLLPPGIIRAPAALPVALLVSADEFCTGEHMAFHR